MIRYKQEKETIEALLDEGTPREDVLYYFDTIPVGLLLAWEEESLIEIINIFFEN